MWITRLRGLMMRSSELLNCSYFVIPVHQILSNSVNLFVKEMYMHRVQSAEFVCGYWGLKDKK